MTLPPTPDRMNYLYRVQISNMRVGYVAVAGAAVCITAICFLDGFNFDRAVELAFLAVIMGLLFVLRTQIMATQLWRSLSMNLEGCFNELHTQYVSLANNAAEARALAEAISQIPEGWMSSYGTMNVSRHQKGNRTGPTCFLWRPDVTLKNGKIESRAVSGEGETVTEAILDAVAQVNAI